MHENLPELWRVRVRMSASMLQLFSEPAPNLHPPDVGFVHELEVRESQTVNALRVHGL